MREDKFTQKAKEALSIAQSSLSKFNHSEMTPLHLLYGLLDDPEGIVPKLIEHMSLNTDQVKNRVLDELEKIPKAYEMASNHFVSKALLII